MAKVSFNVDAYTARLIGRENISNLHGAVLELVKNGYDADATLFIVYFEKSTNSLFLIDNGVGMSKEIIQNHWMTIGNSSKRENFKSGKGRIQTGAKGIGRFALDRLAEDCHMLSTSFEENIEWIVNWNDFSDNKKITDVTADLFDTSESLETFLLSVKNTDVYKTLVDTNRKNGIKTGTILKLNNLHDAWSIEQIRIVAENLSHLLPYELKDVFKIYFFEEDTGKKDAEIIPDEASLSNDYEIKFSVSENQNVNISILRNEFEFAGEFNKIMIEAHFSPEDKGYFSGKRILLETDLKSFLSSNQDAINRVGAFSGVLYFNKKSFSKVDKEKYYYKDNFSTNSSLESSSGIKIYRDNFRIRPYGEDKSSGYDWLQLAPRKQLSPAAPSHPTGSWRVSSEQIKGSIFISRLNLYLKDQANREGIVESEEFLILKDFIIRVILEFERDRQYVFKKLSSYYEEKHELSVIEEKIKKASESKENEEGYDPIVDKSALDGIGVSVKQISRVIDNKQQTIEELEDENRLLRALATTGIVTNTYVHEFQGITNQLGQKIVNAKEAITIAKNMKKAEKYLNEASLLKDSFSSWYRVTIGSVKRDNRKKKNLVITDFLANLTENWNSIFEPRGIKIHLSFEENFQFRCFSYEVETIISNLISNSVHSFTNYGYPNQDKNIFINISRDEDYMTIDYYDTGKGLSQKYKEKPSLILESFESDRKDQNSNEIGTGMGMWIINKTVLEYKGAIDLSRNKIECEGFYINIKLREVLGGRKNV